MTRLVALLLLVLTACSNYDPALLDGHKDVDLRMAWETLWDILDKRYDVGDSQCYYAYDTTTIEVVPMENILEAGCDAIGCTISNFTPDLPYGAYTIVLRENLGRGVLCRVAFEELVHVAHRCQMQNDPRWPDLMGAHPHELFDVPGTDNDGHYPVQLELEAMELERCRNG